MSTSEPGLLVACCSMGKSATTKFRVSTSNVILAGYLKQSMKQAIFFYSVSDFENEAGGNVDLGFIEPIR